MIAWRLCRRVAPGLAALLLSPGVAACGEHGHQRTTRKRAVAAAPAPASRPGANLPYMNDGDNDPSNDNDPDNGKPDDDNDAFEDSKHPENGRYHDKDDKPAVYGQLAGAADRATIAALIERYGRAARAHDGKVACSMMYSVLEESMPEDYGRPPGPPYLRGSTCQAVMGKLFRHSEGKLTAHFTVTEVRVKGRLAFVALGAKTMPASAMFVEREHGAWKINSPLPAPLA